MATFKALGVSSEFTEVIHSLGYTEPTPIQGDAIPLILSGRDVIGQAQTGTGKTAAFGIPLLQRLQTDQRHVQALILTPTRELALQVARSLESYGAHKLKGKVCRLYGGQPIQPQIAELRGSPQVVVGTPGRIIDHLQRGTLQLNMLNMLVLDEADEMLKMGFSDEVALIVSHTPQERQTLLFSATMPPEIEEIAVRYLNASQTRIVISGEGRGSDDVQQQYMLVRKDDQFEALTRLLELEHSGISLIFVKTRRESTQLADRLHARDHAVEVLNGELNQHLRESVVRRLRTGKTSAVVATDVAARGLDIDGISLVVNYHMPTDFESYVHRIGRTGRAGRVGKAVLLVTPRESRSLRRLEEHLGRKLISLPPPSPEEVLESRLHQLRTKLKRTLDEVNTHNAEVHVHYQEILDRLVESGVPSERLALAALKLATHRAPLIEANLPKALPHISLEGLAARRQASLNPKPGCSIVVLHSGRDRGVRPKDIVGAISHEAKVDGGLVGLIRIEERRSLFELPDDQVALVIERLTGKRLCGAPARFTLWDGKPESNVHITPNKPEVNGAVQPRVTTLYQAQDRSRASTG